MNNNEYQEKLNKLGEEELKRRVQEVGKVVRKEPIIME